MFFVKNLLYKTVYVNTKIDNIDLNTGLNMNSSRSGLTHDRIE